MSTITRNKLLPMAGLGLIVLLLATWFLGNRLASQKAEDKIRQLLVSTKLSSQVQWENLHANLFGKVTLEKITIGPKKSPIKIEKATLSGFENSTSSLSGKLQISGLADANGQSLLLEHEILRNAGYRQAVPANISLNWDINKTKGTANIAAELVQQKAFKAESKFLFKGLHGLIALIPNNESQLSTELFNPMSLFGLGQALENIQITSASAELENDGYTQRIVALQKRYDTPVPFALALNKVQNKAFEQHIDALIQSCSLPNEALQLLSNPLDSCKNIYKFINGQKDSLALSLNHKSGQPLSLDQFIKEMGKL